LRFFRAGTGRGLPHTGGVTDQPDAPPPPPWQPPPAYPPPSWQPSPPPYGAPPNQGPAGWQYPGGSGQPYGYPRPRNTNGFAIASLVCSLVGIFLVFVGPALGVVFGIVGLKQTSRLGESGRGLAIAGVVIGALMMLLDVVAVISVATTHTGGGAGGVSV
jgi:Domain of unknown function (DUF4190)